MGIMGLILAIAAVIICVFMPFKWLSIAIAIVSLIVSGGNIFVRLKNDEKYMLSVIVIIISIISIVISTLFLTISQEDDSKLNGSNENIYRIGNVYKQEELNIKLVSADTDFGDVDKYYVTPGYKVMKIVFDIENKGETNILFTENDFECYSNDVECQNFYINNNNFCDIKPGNKESVIYYYEIPVDFTDIKIVYKQSDISKPQISFVIE